MRKWPNGRAITRLAAMLCLAACAPAPQQVPTLRWAVYYNDILPASDFMTLDLVVFDRKHHPSFNGLKRKTNVLAYISIGEIADDPAGTALLKKKKALLAPNARWKSDVVDIREIAWKKSILDKAANAAKQGFDGVMLDTIDSPLYWAETKAPEHRDAMRAAAIGIIRAIRAAHPTMKIMLNRGFTILPHIASDIDYVLAESILSNTDVSSGQFGLFPPDTYGQVAKQLHHVRALAPQLQILTLDYWNMDDGDGLAHIYAAQRAQGFSPYISTPDLRNFTPERETR